MSDDLTPPADALTAIQAQFDRMAGGLGAIHRAWLETVGPELAAVSMPVALKGGDLHISCASPAWAAEILHRADELIERLAPRLSAGSELVRLRPRAGRVAWDRSAPHEHPAPPRIEPNERQLRAAHNEISAGIADPELLEAMERAMAASKARRASEGLSGPENAL